MKKNIKIKKPVKNGRVKVPIVIQLEELECGAACLGMVMAYYEKWVPLEQLRVDCGVSRNGSKASNIVTAAEGYGFKVQGYKFEVNDILNEGTFPCVIHWNFNHFVVLNGIKGDKVYINDPAQGSYTITMDQFEEAYTGVCILFEPTDNFVVDGRPKSTLDFARKRLKGTGSTVLFIVATLIISSLMGLITPVFSRIFIDRILTRQNPEWFTMFMIGFICFNIVVLVLGWIKAIFSYKLSGKLAATADFNFFWHVLRLPMTFFSQRMTGDIIMRQLSNTGIVNTLVGTFAPLVLNTAMMFFYLVVILRYSVLLTVIGLISIAVDMIIARIISTRRVNISRVQARDIGKLSSETLSGVEMIETIKASGAENGFFEKWSGYQASINSQSVKVSVLEQYIGLIPAFVSMITSTTILILGIYLTIQGEFTVGMIMAFQGFLTSFRQPINSIIKAGQTIQEMRTNMERIEDVLQYETDVDYSESFDENAKYDKLTGKLSLRNVSFAYSALDEPIIKNFNLELESGKSVAFVGSSGCGKSTLSKLISGLYKQCEGEILFDDIPISSINHAVFTSSVAVVDQDITLFADTFGENIKMWDNTIENFEVIMAARDASIHETIIEREGGYSSKLKEGGKDLSGGQRQRLEIARALAQDPTLIILDEATAALDSKTEFDVVRSIKNRGITCVVIAHRLSAVRNCDEIIVLDKGEIVERGTHEQLYKQGGMYTALVSNE